MLYLFIVVEQVSTITILSSSLTDGHSCICPCPYACSSCICPCICPYACSSCICPLSAPMPVPVVSVSAPVSVVSSPVPVVSAPISSWSPSNFGSDDDDVFEPPLLPPSVKPRTLYTWTSNTDQGRFYFTLTCMCY